MPINRDEIAETVRLVTEGNHSPQYWEQVGPLLRHLLDALDADDDDESEYAHIVLRAVPDTRRIRNRANLTTDATNARAALPPLVQQTKVRLLSRLGFPDPTADSTGTGSSR